MMNSDSFSDVRIKIRNNNKIFFNQNSECLKPLLNLIASMNHRTMVLWALKMVREIHSSIRHYFDTDNRVGQAIILCEKWAKGDIKMQLAKKAILEVHHMAKETDNLRVITKLHAIGQGLSTIHVKTHAIGMVFYDLTSAVLEYGIDSFEEAVKNKINEYIITLKTCNQEINKVIKWNSFLMKDMTN